MASEMTEKIIEEIQVTKKYKKTANFSNLRNRKAMRWCWPVTAAKTIVLLVKTGAPLKAQVLSDSVFLAGDLAT